MSLLPDSCIGGHIVGLYLLLEGNVDADVALMFIDCGRGIRLP